MKCFTLLLFFMVSMNFSSLSISYAEEVQLTVIESISYNLEPDEKESVNFKLSGSIAGLNIFRLNGANPRLVLDFPQVSYSGKKIILADNRRLAHGIRIGAHTAPVMKTRVVIDLLNEYEVKYEKVFSDDNTVLKITLSPIFIEKLEKEMDVPQIAVAQGIGIAKTKTEESVPPASTEIDTLIAKDLEPESSDSGAKLLEISFDNSSNKGEMVIFRLNDFYPPAVSAIEEEETPRVLCDFMDMQLAGEVNREIAAKGKYVQHIRTARHGNPDNIRVILDLSPDKDYDLQQVFFKNDNLFVLIVNELPEVVSD
ncbi:MAG: AMIN domain-containing protein [Desulfobulbaceae bacterium]|nr:AMIN domain-containing protein [Desulfobulbaceae bacterium]